MRASKKKEEVHVAWTPSQREREEGRELNIVFFEHGCSWNCRRSGVLQNHLRVGGAFVDA